MALLDSRSDRGAIESEAFGTARAQGGEEGLVSSSYRASETADLSMSLNLE